jgi:hypothetical protein
MRTLTLLLLLTAAPLLQAQALGPLDRMTLAVGVFDGRLSLDGQVRANGTWAGEARRVADDFELGSSRAMELAEFSWSPWERHEFGVRYLRDRYRRTVRLSEEVRLEGQTFPVDVDLDGRTRFAGLEFDYTWWMFANDRSALGLQLGVLRLGAGVSLRGRVSSPDAGTVTLDANVSDHLYAPLIGIAGRHVFGERLRGFAELRAIELGFNGNDGTALAGTAGIEYLFGERVGLALQYADTRVRVERERERASGRLEFGLRGPQALLRLRF